MTAPAPPVRAWIEQEGALLRLHLARPKANVLDAAMIAALDAALTAELGRPGLRGVLIDAEGPHFSFGASVEEHLPDACAAMLRDFHALLLRLLAPPLPVLVAVRGQCLGGGLELAMTATRIFAAPGAMLGQPEIRLGVFAPAASCLLPELIGPAAAEDLLLSGRSLTAAEALSAGLVQAVADDPEAAAIAWFTMHLADKSAMALRCAMQAARGDRVERVRRRLGDLEALYLNDLMRGHDALEGLTAFLEKRPPRWEHR
ncbi:cyclohexa-1,5-dienecarbonyl-CoA hydratase [Rhodopila globiformis]|uniref:Cyclohexa-1,5-dienecarbonyl-CoA hydratase n=1 Tax=Rhodopila globiformis TaxID=1071 RepID=A0A2S6MW22_RHOGL|nr:cyclohexa-1,5-dienecarbonyl-CoA hydratase [Rhodopila globiformis]PPQ26566.1 cyclohexa-1,5-dienecarbonyl-CoA hydratase [Rhodopila globiformis]